METEPSNDLPNPTEVLLAAHHEGDRAAAEELFHRHRDSVAATLRQGLENVDIGYGDAEDLIQETLLSAWQRLDEFVPRNPGAFRRWLMQIARNRMVDVIRKARAARRDARLVVRFGEAGRCESKLEARTESPSFAAKLADQRTRRAGALARMPRFHAQLIELHEDGALSFDVIGQELGMNKEAARMAYRRARERLNRLLEDD